MSISLSSIGPIEPNSVQIHYNEAKKQEPDTLVTIEHGFSANRSYRDQQIALVYDDICHENRCEKCKKLTPYNPELSPCGRPEKKQAIQWIVRSLLCTGIMYGIAYYRNWQIKWLH